MALACPLSFLVDLPVFFGFLFTTAFADPLDLLDDLELDLDVVRDFCLFLTGDASLVRL